LSGVIAHGMLDMAFLAQLLTRWVPQKSIRMFNARFVAMAYPGDVISCTGKIAGKSEADHTVELELAAANQRGEKVLTGKATVALPQK